MYLDWNQIGDANDVVMISVEGRSEMSDHLYRVVAPHFVAGFLYDDKEGVFKSAPIIKYMNRWSFSDISKYCHGKGWKIEEIKLKEE